ncbi:hypothetical protein VTN00DRAFT_3933 [Thermoascus crustaceus]|uniref:uncharacterized protein n=1 Tax=Thermoascus crustaceus TaxID=5088 RepID=UPI0037435536
MGRFGFFSLALLSLQSLFVGGLATDAAENVEDQSETPKLAVQVQTSFPASEIFGVKLVNGQPTQALISFSNEESAPITVNFIGGSLWTLNDESKIIRNLTTSRYNVEIPAGETQDLSYSFVTDLHPQDLRLNLATVVSDSEGKFFTIHAFNRTVSVVEPDTSIFDPQIIFLYFFLLSCFGGIVYFFYTIWIAPYFPQKRKTGKAGDARKSAGAAKKVDEQVPVPDGPAVTSATTYNAEWIPAHHINRPEPRKVKGSGSRSRSRA